MNPSSATRPQSNCWRFVFLLTTLTTSALAQDVGPSGAAATNSPPAISSAPRPSPTDPADTSAVDYADFFHGDTGASTKGIDWVQAISVSSPAYCSDIKGDTTVTFTAPGMTLAKAFCWQQPTTDHPSPWGHDTDVAPDLKLDPSGNGSFVFHADQYPNGPITLRIQAKDGGIKQDICELQLFNKGGVVWDQGIPKSKPPAAQGMKLAFSDDFSGPLSISKNGDGATYQAHTLAKPNGKGNSDFSGWPFGDNDGPDNPFSQIGTWLRIHASKKPGEKGSTGLLSTLHDDRSGFTATVPCYFECRFLAQSAPGTWPAFWLLSKQSKDPAVKNNDEYDINESYGGLGPKNPNNIGYQATTHFWGQPRPAWNQAKGPNGKRLHPNSASVPMMDLGGKSLWSTTFHTYGLLITPTRTSYYLDGIEVLRHPTGPVAKSGRPLWFLINYAIGGISGWHIDLDRYGNQSDMWVDYVRVYQGKP